MTSSGLVIQASYSYPLVALSILISMLAAWAALDLAGRVAADRGGARVAWLIGGATASGIGSWSMHYTGMLAFRLPVPVEYDWPTVLISLLPAVFASAVAIFVVSQRRTEFLRVLIGGVFMGGGIACLHYTAMAAMRLPAMCYYSAGLVILSVVLPMPFCLMALRFKFLVPDVTTGRRLSKVASALLMGAANPVMHYTGMAAATFARSAIAPDLSHAVPISLISVACVTAVPLMALGVALITSLVGQLHKQNALLDVLFEQAPQAVALTNADNGVLRVNGDFARVFGYTPQETAGRRLDDLIVPAESRDEFRKHTEPVMAHGQRVDVEGIGQRKDGSCLHVSMVRVPVSLPDGQSAVYSIFRDITERKRAEEELEASRDKLRALAARLQSVREEERTRVAREIHDELGQALTAIKFGLSSLIPTLSEDQQLRSDKIESLQQLADQTIQSVRRIATNLRPRILDELGLAPAVEWAAEEFEARTGIRCRLDLPEDDVVVDQERATALFRILQEALTNVTRHAHATDVQVRLAGEDGGLTLEVHDNGQGFDDKQLSRQRSLGILGMQERALILGGEFTVTSAPGKGTTVRVRIPEARQKQREENK
jgi:PAS domain S-box-containing protein